MTTATTPSTTRDISAMTAEIHSIARQIRQGEAEGMSPAYIERRRVALHAVMREIADANGTTAKVAASRALAEEARIAGDDDVYAEYAIAHQGRADERRAARETHSPSAHVAAEAAARAAVADETAPRFPFAEAHARAELDTVEIIDAEIVEETTPEPARLPVGDADNIRDPRYIHARIQEAFQRAKEYRPEGTSPERAEVISLTVSLESLARDLQFHGPAGDAFVAHLETIAPGRWGRAATIYTHAADDATAMDYAARLGIPEIKPYKGRVWRGMHQGFEVSIYGPTS